MSTIKVKSCMEIERDWACVEIKLTGNFIPSTPDVWYLRNGDPGYPGTDAEMDAIEAHDSKGEIVELTEAETEKAQDALFQAASELEQDFQED